MKTAMPKKGRAWRDCSQAIVEKPASEDTFHEKPLKLWRGILRFAVVIGCTGKIAPFLALVLLRNIDQVHGFIQHVVLMKP